MNPDMTRRTILQMAGASSLAAAASAAARAEGNAGGGPTFANRTPMRVGMVTLRVRKLDPVADFYRDVIGLAVMERSTTAATLGAGGVKLLVLEAYPEAAEESKRAAGLYHTAFLMPTRKDLARWLVHAAIHRVPLSGFADHRVSESVYLDDPEGNGIEVYADRDPALWQWNAGTVTMGTDQLDIDDLVSLTNTKVSDYAKAPDGTRICASAISRRPVVSIATPSASIRRANARARRSSRPAATIIISASTSGRVPAPDAATTRQRGLRGSRWRSRSRICLPPRKSGCARLVAKP
jgi:catechol 2,3-dioxygenase